MRVQYDVMVQEFARVLEKKGFTHEDAENAAIIFAQNSLAGVYSHGLNRFPRVVSYLEKGEIGWTSWIWTSECKTCNGSCMRACEGEWNWLCSSWK